MVLAVLAVVETLTFVTAGVAVILFAMHSPEIMMLFADRVDGEIMTEAICAAAAVIIFNAIEQK